MNCPRVALGLALTALAAAKPLQAMGAEACGQAAEANLWPLKTERRQASGITSATGMGPFFYAADDGKGNETRAFRPFFLYRSDKAGQRTETDILYPLFFYRSNGEYWKWSLFNLINRSAPRSADKGGDTGGFDLWPFWFSRETGDPSTSYKGLFPISGTIKNRLTYNRIEWELFPLYLRLDDSTKTSQYSPWPFIKVISGEHEKGWSVWPLMGHRAEPGKSRADYLLWPFVYRSAKHLDEAVPEEKTGVLPLYAVSTAEGYRSESYIWPFFGWSERTLPYKYQETRYLWPLFIQGRGEDRQVNRWAPLYTHSTKAGVDKTWVLWPLWRDQKWMEAGLAQEKRQLFYFVYWSLEQKRPGAPEGAPTANKTHLWPLFSSWDNGAGRTQLQVLSPFEVFFPQNDEVRQLWSPLFALYRTEQREPGSTRGALLWNAVTWDRNEKAGTRSVFLGPLYATTTTPAERRVALLAGLLSWRRPAAGGWHFKFADFNRTPARPETTEP